MKRGGELLSLVGCPECGRDVSSIAELCPKCGFPAALFHGSPPAEGSPYVRVASNPQASASLLGLMSQSEDWEIRAAVAKNPAAPSDLLWVLSEDADEDVRAAVAENGNAPISVLENLVDDVAIKVVIAVSKNLGAPEYILTVARSRIDSAEWDDDSCGCDDAWYDDPAYYDSLPEGYYKSRSGDFYVNENGERCVATDSSDEGGMRMYFSEDNSCWLEC